MKLRKWSLFWSRHWFPPLLAMGGKGKPAHRHIQILKASPWIESSKPRPHQLCILKTWMHVTGPALGIWKGWDTAVCPDPVTMHWSVWGKGSFTGLHRGHSWLYIPVKGSSETSPRYWLHAQCRSQGFHLPCLRRYWRWKGVIWLNTLLKDRGQVPGTILGWVMIINAAFVNSTEKTFPKLELKQSQPVQGSSANGMFTAELWHSYRTTSASMEGSLRDIETKIPANLFFSGLWREFQPLTTLTPHLTGQEQNTDIILSFSKAQHIYQTLTALLLSWIYFVKSHLFRLHQTQSINSTLQVCTIQRYFSKEYKITNVLKNNQKSLISITVIPRLFSSRREHVTCQGFLKILSSHLVLHMKETKLAS